jgi:vitamin B12/bleomycin/antimicrobial peptide transport system ATP-binding/permease protein
VTEHPISLALVWQHFSQAMRYFALSDVASTARWMFVALLVFLLAINGMNVINSYVGRDFMTAIAERNQPEFVRQALFYVGVFAVSTLLSVSMRYMEERLALFWRKDVTERAVARYLADSSYHRLDVSHFLSNPDQRISEDARSFTSTTLSFVLMVLNSGFTIFAFSGVLWSISPQLFVVAVLYAAGGSLLTILLGRPLIKLNYDQLDREANFRSGLIHVRENAEAVLLAHSEARLSHRLQGLLNSLVENARRIIGVNRNLGFFTTGYNWLIQIIPALIIAPAFIEGKVEFGVVTQSAMAFSTLVAAFSLIITQFQSISSFAAVVSRLITLVDAVDQSKHEVMSSIDIRMDEGRLAYESGSLRSPENGHVLVDKLSLVVPPRGRCLIRAEEEDATVALFRATAGLGVVGEGSVVLPGPQAIQFLAERPYLPPGNLREALVPPPMDAVISDQQIVDVMVDWHLEPILTRASGLYTEHDWDSFLSLGEQQLLAALRVLLAAPQFVIIDRPGTALNAEGINNLLSHYSAAAIGFIVLGPTRGSESFYDAVIDIRVDGQWR